jgi:hypothetical protein
MRSLSAAEAIICAQKLDMGVLTKNLDLLLPIEKSIYAAIMLKSMDVSPDDGVVGLLNLNDSNISNDQKEKILINCYGEWNTALDRINSLNTRTICVFDCSTREYLMILKQQCKINQL